MGGKELFEKMWANRGDVEIGNGEVARIFVEKDMGELGRELLGIGAGLAAIAEEGITAIGYFGPVFGKLI
jgi:hypothetical protein